jgi:microcystin-dependent protein
MATKRVQIGVTFMTPETMYVASSSGGSPTTAVSAYIPVSGAAITILDRNTGNAPTVYTSESGSGTIGSISTDSGGNVNGWVVEGSYTVTAGAVGSFAGASIAWEAVRGDGVENIFGGAVVVASLAQEVVNYLVPSGVILDHGGSVAPPGYVLCDGSVYATGTVGTTYYNLSQALNGAWNTGGEGTGNFRVPDFRGRTAVGAGTGSGLTNRVRGTYGGEEAHVLSVGELAVHAHTDAGHAHSVSDPSHAHSVADPAHAHIYVDGGGSQVFLQGTAPSGNFNIGSQFSTEGVGHASANTAAAGTGIGIYGAYTNISIVGGNANIQNTGSSTAHNTMQPYGVTNKIIKL